MSSHDPREETSLTADACHDSNVGRCVELTKRLLLIIFVAALICRCGWGVYRISQSQDAASLEFPDEQQYWLMAESLREGKGLRDEFGFRATRMPLYPTLLSVFVASEHGVIAAKAMQWTVGALAAVLAALLAARMFDRRAGVWAGLFVAFDPFLIFFSSLLLTETLFVVALLGLWFATWPIVATNTSPITKWRWVAVGLLASTCIYLRESSVGLLVLLALLCVLRRRRDWRCLAVILIVSFVVRSTLVPWAIRNGAVIGEMTRLTTRGGISLYDGVGPQADGSSNLGDVQQMPAVRWLSETEWNHYFFEKSLEEIRNNPRRILDLAIIKLNRLWNPFPNVGTYQSHFVRAVSAIWTIPIYVCAIAALPILLRMRNRRGAYGVVLMILPALYFSAIHSLFVGSVRYRIPAMPMIEILAAVVVASLVARLTRGRSNEGPASHVK